MANSAMASPPSSMSPSSSVHNSPSTGWSNDNAAPASLQPSAAPVRPSSVDDERSQKGSPAEENGGCLALHMKQL